MNGNELPPITPSYKSQMYGVWRKGKGWLKGKEPIAFDNKDVAQEVAKLIHGEVRFIDASLIDIEHLILNIELERKSPWDTLLNLFKRKTNT